MIVYQAVKKCFFLTSQLVLIGLGGCRGYASHQELIEVQATVATVKREQLQVVDQTNHALHVVNNRVEGLQARQAATESAFVQMGKGFNLLTESVSEAYNASEKVARVQRQHESEARKLLASIAPRLPEVEETVWLHGTPMEISAGKGLPIYWLEVNQNEQNLYVGAAGSRLRGRSIGNRIYGVAATGDPATACLELLEGDPDSGFFAAAACDNPLHLYSFVTTDPPAFAP